MPGLLNGEAIDPANSAAVTGIEIKLLGGGPQAGAGRRIPARLSDFDHPLAADISPSHTIGGVPADVIFFVADQDASIVARQSLKGSPAVAVKEQPTGWTSVYSSFPGLPLPRLRCFAGRGGDRSPPSE